MDAAINWRQVADDLNKSGFAVAKMVLSRELCSMLRAMYGDPARYRSVINMRRYRFGEGEYKYFNYPLPDIVSSLRKQFYTGLAPIANEWMASLNIHKSFPPEHEAFIRICAEAGQKRPTPLILRYEQGGYNTLHQDLYGDVYFPFQVLFVLSDRTTAFTGGKFVMTEQIPRAQSKASVLDPDMGDAVIFTTNFRPVKGTRGYYRAAMKHGISEVTSGTRYAMGIIFHDAA